MFRRNGRVGRRGSGARPATPLERQIANAYAAAGWTAVGVFLARAADITDAATAEWRDSSGHGYALQSSGGAKPTWSTTGLNSLPAWTFDGGDLFTSATAIDMSGYSAYALSVLFQDSNTTVKVVAQHSISTALRFGIFVNDGSAGDVTALHNTTAGVIGSRVRSAASYPMTSPAVVTATGDRALATNEGEIRHGGANVTNTRATNSNSAGKFESASFYVGAQNGPANGITGAIAAVVLAGGTTAVPTTAVGTVEALLAAQWGL